MSDLAPLHSSKKALRRSLLAQRRALTPAAWQAQSDRLCEQLRQLPPVQAARTVLAYQSFRHEPDLTPLFTALPVVWGLPRCVGERLQWHRWRWGEALVQGQYGIWEPDPSLPILEPSGVDVMLVPCVAGDRAGYRLGYGGGYYDRLLADPAWGVIPAIGIVFDGAYVEQLPREPWDRPLQGFCTESGYYATQPTESP